MRTLFLERHLRNDDAVARRYRARPFRFEGTHSCRVGTCRYGIGGTVVAYHGFHFGAGNAPPVGRMARTHHHVLRIVLRSQLLLRKGVRRIDRVFPVSRSGCREFTPRRSFMLKLNLHLLVGRKFIIDILRGYHHSLDHLLLVRWRRSVVS